MQTITKPILTTWTEVITTSDPRPLTITNHKHGTVRYAITDGGAPTSIGHPLRAGETFTRTLLEGQLLYAKGEKDTDIEYSPFSIGGGAVTIAGGTYYKGTFGSLSSTTGGDLPASSDVGDYYICDTNGYTSIIASLTFNSGDWGIWDGAKWGKLNSKDAVLSVNGVEVDSGTSNITLNIIKNKALYSGARRPPSYYLDLLGTNGGRASEKVIMDIFGKTYTGNYEVTVAGSVVRAEFITIDENLINPITQGFTGRKFITSNNGTTDWFEWSIPNEGHYLKVELGTSQAVADNSTLLFDGATSMKYGGANSIHKIGNDVFFAERGKAYEFRALCNFLQTGGNVTSFNIQLQVSPDGTTFSNIGTPKPVNIDVNNSHEYRSTPFIVGRDEYTLIDEDSYFRIFVTNLAGGATYTSTISVLEI